MPSIGWFLSSPMGNLVIALTAVLGLVVVIMWPEITKRIPKLTTTAELDKRVSWVETVVKPFRSQEAVDQLLKREEELANRLGKCEKRIESLERTMKH